MDKLTSMQTFTAVVNEGNFARAAERLGLSSQLVSKYVAQLEDTLQVRLLNRTTRRVSLTEAGHLYYQRCQQVLADIDEMENALSDLQSQVSGTLRISAPMSFGVHHLSEPVRQFQLLYPQVKVELALSDRKVDLLDEGVDIALRIGILKDSTLVAKKIVPVNLVVCASPEYLRQHGYPQTMEDLHKLNYLHFTYAEAGNMPQDNAHLMALNQLSSSFSCNNGDVVINIAIAGGGYCVQPTFLTGTAIANGQLQVLDNFPLQPLGLYAVYAHRQFLASKVRHFIDFLCKYYGEKPYWDIY